MQDFSWWFKIFPVCSFKLLALGYQASLSTLNLLGQVWGRAGGRGREEEAVEGEGGEGGADEPRDKQTFTGSSQKPVAASARAPQLLIIENKYCEQPVLIF